MTTRGSWASARERSHCESRPFWVIYSTRQVREAPGGSWLPRGGVASHRMVRGPLTYLTFSQQSGTQSLCVVPGSLAALSDLESAHYFLISEEPGGEEWP